MQVVESFISINGEGMRAGELAVFVRFKGCNLDCGYCDTKWANEPDCAFEEKNPGEIYEAIRQTGVRNVTLTGGEPLLQKEMGELLSLLNADPFLRVEVETNGAVALKPFCVTDRPVFTMDCKLPSSGCEQKMLTENFGYLTENDTVKFVAGSREDLERALAIIRTYDLPGKCSIFFSPVFGKIEPDEIVEFMKEHKLNDVRMQIQMHKVIWDPNARGV